METDKVFGLQQKNECMNFSIYLKLINIPVILHSCTVREKHFSSVAFSLRMIYGYLVFCNKSYFFDKFGIFVYAMRTAYFNSTNAEKSNFAVKLIYGPVFNTLSCNS